MQGDAGHAAPGAGGDVALHGQQDGGPVQLLGQPPRGDAHHSLVPVGAPGHDDGGQGAGGGAGRIGAGERIGALGARGAGRPFGDDELLSAPGISGSGAGGVAVGHLLAGLVDDAGPLTPPVARDTVKDKRFLPNRSRNRDEQ